MSVGIIFFLLLGQDVMSLFQPSTKGELQTAVDAWCGGDQATYGSDINAWDVSLITDMSSLFYDKEYFNDDISSWTTARVTTMANMFHAASSFNQDISSWDISNTVDISYMFYLAQSFNQRIGVWDLASVTDMAGAFAGAESFNQNIDAWDVSRVTNMYALFYGATLFNQDIGSWDVSRAENMDGLLNLASSFNRIICWDLKTSLSALGYSGIKAGPRMSVYSTVSASCECVEGESVRPGPGDRGTCSSVSTEESIIKSDRQLLPGTYIVGALIIVFSCVMVFVAARVSYRSKHEANGEEGCAEEEDTEVEMSDARL